jgi:DNA-damage-inducible protein J
MMYGVCLFSTHENQGVMMNDVIVKSRIEPELKADGEAILAKLGLSASDVIRLTFRQIVARRGLPFDVKIPNDETLAAIKESRAMKIARLKSVKELFDELEGKVRSKL